jgi:flagellar protein FliL
MSEAANEAPEQKKKKKGKLPVIVVLALVLAGGGFFMMKGKGPEEEPKVELGEIVTLTPEFLINLNGNTTYLRTDIAIQLEKGYDAKKLEEHMPALRDAFISTLSSKTNDQVRTLAGKQKLKAELAAAANRVLPPLEDKKKKKTAEEPPAEPKEAAPKEGQKPAAKKDGAKEKAPPKEEIPEGWDSAKGPVLKVFFTSFTTQ